MSKYEFSLTTFNPSGKLLQIEYALRAVQSGSMCLGIKTKDGVVLGAEKKLPPLLDPSTVSKLSFVTEKIGLTYAGMGPDSRVLLRKGRKAGQTYWLQHQEPIPVTQMVRELASIMQEYTQMGGVRPFGTSLLVAGYDHNGAQLYQVDPSGSFWAWKATALGKNMTRFVSLLLFVNVLFFVCVLTFGCCCVQQCQELFGKEIQGRHGDGGCHPHSDPHAERQL